MKDIDLKQYRMRIDEIDQSIIELLQMRFDVVHEIADTKQRKGLPVYDPQREQEKLDALANLCAEEKRTYVSEILKKMMEESRRYQKDHPIRYGLLGRTLGHSHSPAIHEMLGSYSYGLFEREPEQLEEFFGDGAWRGISVTMPYKRDVMKYCDALSDIAKACNSVNTIVRRADGSLYGTNTDYHGFRDTVEKSGIDVCGRKTLVLGSGGVSGTVVKVLEDLGASPVVIISRSGADNYENLDRHTDTQIIVNTTPLGMFPNPGAAAVDVQDFPQLEAVYDLIYNPLRTKLLLDAKTAGIPAFGGLYMLVAQAAKAVELFAQAAREAQKAQKAKEDAAQDPDSPAVPRHISRDQWIDGAYRSLLQQLQHIVLIGMPGAGKTTIGEALAKRIDGQFVDLDGVIAVRMGRTPEQIIRQDGIEKFRKIETKMMRMVLRSGKDRFILATGGGCVEREENRELLQENGYVIWLKRPLVDLPVEGRPVSQQDGVEEILKRRAPAYEAWSDLQIDVTGVPETIDAILRALELL